MTDKNKNSHNNSKLQMLMSKMQMPISALPNCAHFEMNSNRELIIEGSKEILQYDSKFIKINIGKMIIEIEGRDLCIKCLMIDSLVIEGFIISIKFVN